MKGSQKDGNKKREAKIETSTVMFIPSTRGGLLTSMMRERETEMSRTTRFRVKMQESGGIQLARLFSTDLAKGQPCGRQDCQPCEGSMGRTNCNSRSVQSATLNNLSTDPAGRKMIMTSPQAEKK